VYNIHLYFKLLAAEIKSQLQFGGAFLFEFVSNFIGFGLWFLSLSFLFQRFDNLAGWSLGEVALLYGLLETIFALVDMIFSGFDPPFFGRWIRNGHFDQLLLRPVNPLIQVMGSRFVLRRTARIFQGLVVLGVALALTDIQWTPLKVLMVPGMVLGTLLFFGGFLVFGSTLTFWTVESVEVVNILTYGGSEMMSYPMSIYPRWMVRIFTYVIPAIFVIYYPALYLLDRPDPFGLPPWSHWVSPIAGGLVMVAALLFWRLGLRHYQSTGT
jgi:ABC-2 type transport system permease protein